ncbi:MAG: hypothetical protein M1817_000161 [Caeruleum heppii]|nr:MAG: hypothetical protein M1817_000161 [Caeruleum heppii]
MPPKRTAAQASVDDEPSSTPPPKRSRRAVEQTTAASTRSKRTHAAVNGIASNSGKGDGAGGAHSVGGDNKAKDVVISKGGKKAKAPRGSRSETTKTTEKRKSPNEGKMHDGQPHDQEKRYWLMKAEPDLRLEDGVKVSYSIDDLQNARDPEPWDGVRNFVARNNMRAMKKGDLAFFYHSNCKTPGIAGVMKIVGEASADKSQFDSRSPYYDAKSNQEDPRWSVVHVAFDRKFNDVLSLTQLKDFGKDGGALKDMQILRISRLSVSRVSGEEWEFIMEHVDGITKVSKADV